MKKTIIALTIAATATIGIVGTANACSRVVAETDHGTLLMRTADWVSTAPFDAKVAVFPVNTKRVMRGDAKEYQTQMKEWTTKYHTVSFEEWGAFSGLSGQAVNEHGLSAMLLSQHDSEYFIADHAKVHDNGAPAVNLSDLSTYVAENYKTTQEVHKAVTTGEFQIAWSAEVADIGAPAPLHFSVVDADGKIMLIQLVEGGAQTTYLGDKDSDLRVQTNDPFQNKHREYVSQFDLTDPTVMTKIAYNIDGKSRNARLLATSAHAGYTNKSYNTAVGQFKSTFESQAIVPFGLVDPVTNGDYPSFFSMTFNLDNGDMWFKSYISANEVKFTMDETKKFTKPMRASIQQTTDAGEPITWEIIN